jgi:hypothetical protein
MPNPDDPGGGTPHSFGYLPGPDDPGGGTPYSFGYLPGPDDPGGGTPHSFGSFMPSPDDPGGGTPRSSVGSTLAHFAEQSGNLDAVTDAPSAARHPQLHLFNVG